MKIILMRLYMDTMSMYTSHSPKRTGRLELMSLRERLTVVSSKSHEQQREQLCLVVALVERTTFRECMSLILSFDTKVDTKTNTAKAEPRRHPSR